MTDEIQTSQWYDTRQGIIDAVDKGIAGLHELQMARSEAGYKRGVRMDEWCVEGLFWMDTCGNFSKIVEGAPRDRIRELAIPSVMTRAEAMKISTRWSSAMGTCLPPVVEKCDRCHKGWDMRNIADYREPRREDDPQRHASCHALYVIEREQALFKSILDKSGLVYSNMWAIPNEYYNDPGYFGPWFIVSTTLGPLRIGCRKRVINIDWSGTDIAHDGDVLFKDENVTTWDKGVHAWGSDKAIEYLHKLSK